MRRFVVVVVLLVAAVAAVGAWRARGLPVPIGSSGAAPPVVEGVREVRVAYPVHTSRSDGTGTPASIAAAAAEAGLDAVILTDHGDGTRATDPPRRIGAVLVVDAAEISTWGGHYVALGARPSPYALGGDPASVVEDVARLGGVGIAAHPGSAKDALKWRAWDAPFDGIEWLNADTEWRDRPRDLWSAMLTYPWASTSTIVSLLNRPRFELSRWDRASARRAVVGLAAHDAHARLGLSGVGEPYDGAVALRVPGYAAMFRAFSNTVRVPAAWGRDAATDATALVDAIRAGRTYAVVTGFGDVSLRRFSATSGARTAAMGEWLAPDGPVQVDVDLDVPPSAFTSLICAGTRVAGSSGGRLTWRGDTAPGACRVESARSADADTMPWVITNPIYIRAERETGGPRPLATAGPVLPVPRSGDAAAWSIEAAPGASASATADPAQPRRVVARWQLGPASSTFAALVLPTPADFATYDRLVLRAAANRPMRVWVQLRSPKNGGRRWGRSVFLDATPQAITLPLSSFLPMDGDGPQQVPLVDITTLLLVADTTNARPGDAGVVTFDEWWMGR
ncbi:MAG: hypothetical protein U0P30_07490 [Vicinamibacterales bacterium]